MQGFTLSQGGVESGEISFTHDYSMISHGLGDTQLCLNLHFGILAFCLYVTLHLHVFLQAC